MRAVLLLAVLASIVIAAHAVTVTRYQPSDSTCTGTVNGDVLSLGNGECVPKGNPITDSRKVVCPGSATELITYTVWTGATPCTGTAVSYASRNESQGNAACVPMYTVASNTVSAYIKIDCTSGASMLAVSTMIVAVLAAVAHRFTL